MVERPVGERVSRLEAQSEERLGLLKSIDGKVDKLDTRIDTLDSRIDSHEKTINEAIGAFKAYAKIWAFAAVVIASIISLGPHLFGWTK